MREGYEQNTDNKKKTDSIRFLCFLAAVLLLLSGCSLWIHLTPAQTYSAVERRMLEKRPALAKKSVQSGKFQRKYESFLSEQFPGRTQLVALQTKLRRLLGERDANGVYFGKDDYLLEQHQEQEFDWKQVKNNVRQVAAFLKDYPNAKVMFVPSKSSVLSSKLPMFAQAGADSRFFALAAKQIPQERQILVSDVLKAHDTEYIYYRTDHHWTTLGAYYAYQEWARSMGLAAVAQQQFEVTPVCTSFFGTTYAKVRTGGRADTIHLYERKDAPEYTFEYNRGETELDSFYDLSKLEGDDPYSVFFGGNQALADIRAEGGEDGKTLLVIKDSFGNCFAPFAANHYARVIVADLRYVNLPVSKLLRVYPADDILILYNSVQFMEDRDISKLK
ncbi:MAG: hypothetical protein K2N87_13090 [Eubacterium sp.]|nr:hypothetical protein [Eubacterium sp.]